MSYILLLVVFLGHFNPKTSGYAAPQTLSMILETAHMTSKTRRFVHLIMTYLRGFLPPELATTPLGAARQRASDLCHTLPWSGHGIAAVAREFSVGLTGLDNLKHCKGFCSTLLRIANRTDQRAITANQ